MPKLPRFNRMHTRSSFSGNTLAEYALPLSLIVVGGGVMLTFVNTGNLLPNFLAQSSGGTVNGKTVESPSMGTTVNGPLSNGASGGVGNGTYIAGASGKYFFSGPAFNSGNGNGAPETVGNNGNGWQLKMPTPPAGYKQGGALPPGDDLHYVPTVNQSVDTGKAMSKNDAMAAALVATKYADSARIQIAVTNHPEEVKNNGDWAGLAYGNEARENQINAGVEGTNKGIAEEVQKEAESIKGDSDQAIESWANANAMAEMHTIPQETDGSGTLNPDGYEKWVKQKVIELQKELMANWTPPEDAKDE